MATVIIQLFLLILVGSALATEIAIPTVRRVPNEDKNRTIVNAESKFSFVYPSGWAPRIDISLPGVKSIVQSTSSTRVANCNVRAVIDTRLNSISNDEYIAKVFPRNDPSELLRQFKDAAG